MFKKGQSGNPNGRKKGSKNTRLKQWDQLGDSISNEQAGQFNEYLNELWKGTSKQKLAAAELYLKVLDYFKPKLSRVESKNTNDNTLNIKLNKDVRNLAGLSSRKPTDDTRE